MNDHKEASISSKIHINDQKYSESNAYFDINEIIDTTIPEKKNNINVSINFSKFFDINNNLKNKVKTQRKLYVELEDGTNVIQPEKYCKNRVQTNQYSILTFLPLALFNQYKSVFNWLFLITAILSLTKLTNASAFANTFPVVLVLVISLIREAIEDYNKYKDDEKINKTKVLIYKAPSFQKIESKKVKIGNIIKIKKGQTIPADVLIIKTSLDNGFCYMQTTNLDGESAFKQRESISLSQKIIDINKPITFNNLLTNINENCYIEVDIPSKDIYKIEGII